MLKKMNGKTGIPLSNPLQGGRILPLTDSNCPGVPQIREMLANGKMKGVGRELRKSYLAIACTASLLSDADESVRLNAAKALEGISNRGMVKSIAGKFMDLINSSVERPVPETVFLWPFAPGVLDAALKAGLDISRSFPDFARLLNHEEKHVCEGAFSLLEGAIRKGLDVSPIVPILANALEEKSPDEFKNYQIAKAFLLLAKNGIDISPALPSICGALFETNYGYEYFAQAFAHLALRGRDLSGIFKSLSGCQQCGDEEKENRVHVIIAQCFSDVANYGLLSSDAKMKKNALSTILSAARLGIDTLPILNRVNDLLCEHSEGNVKMKASIAVLKLLQENGLDTSPAITLLGAKVALGQEQSKLALTQVMKAGIDVSNMLPSILDVYIRSPSNTYYGNLLLKITGDSGLDSKRLLIGRILEHVKKDELSLGAERNTREFISGVNNFAYLLGKIHTRELGNNR